MSHGPRNRNRRAEMVASASMIAIGALALHRLAYSAVHGPAGEGAVDGHGYLTVIAPLLVIVAPLMLAGAVLVPALLGTASRTRSTLTRHAAMLAGAMLLAFFGQELLEAAATGAEAHAAAELMALLPYALPLAIALGFGSALLVEALAAGAQRLAAVWGRVRVARARQVSRTPVWLDVRPFGALLLGFALACRPPPLR